MTTTRAVEFRITQRLLRRRAVRKQSVSAEALIVVVSVVACLGVLAVFVPGLLWVMLAASVALTLGLN